MYTLGHTWPWSVLSSTSVSMSPLSLVLAFSSRLEAWCFSGAEKVTTFKALQLELAWRTWRGVASRQSASLSVTQCKGRACLLSSSWKNSPSWETMRGLFLFVSFHSLNWFLTVWFPRTRSSSSTWNLAAVWLLSPILHIPAVSEALGARGRWGAEEEGDPCLSFPGTSGDTQAPKPEKLSQTKDQWITCWLTLTKRKPACATSPLGCLPQITKDHVTCQSINTSV